MRWYENGEKNSKYFLHLEKRNFLRKKISKVKLSNGEETDDAETILEEEKNFLRSTKWNASLILLRDCAELVALCKVIVWKTHIPVRTQKWPPRLIFAGACHSIVINYGHGQ